MDGEGDADLEEYDGTQFVQINLLMPGVRLEALTIELRRFGYITYLKAEDAPDAVVRFSSVGHAIRLKRRTTKKDEEGNWECECGTGGQGGNYCTNCGRRLEEGR